MLHSMLLEALFSCIMSLCFYLLTKLESNPFPTVSNSMIHISLHSVLSTSSARQKSPAVRVNLQDLFNHYLSIYVLLNHQSRPHNCQRAAFA